MTEDAKRELLLDRSLVPSPTPLPSSSEERAQRKRIQWHLAAAWLITIHMAAFSAWMTFVSPPSLRPRSQIALGLAMVFLISVAASGWCAFSFMKFPRPSWNPRAIQLGGLWVMTGVVIYQAALQFMIGRFPLLGGGGVVGMAICVALMWVVFWRNREAEVKQ